MGVSVIKGLFWGIVSSLKKKPIDYDETVRIKRNVLAQLSGKGF